MHRIFAICQSSEMAFLKPQEKLDIARAVTQAVDGRIQVVASGHTADDKATQFKEIEDMMKIPGIGAYVLVSNRLDQKNEGRPSLRPTPRRSSTASPRWTSASTSAPYPSSAWCPSSFSRRPPTRAGWCF